VAALPAEPHQEGVRARPQHRALHRHHRRRAGGRGGESVQGALLLARTTQSQWDVGDQPPEFWNQFKTEFAPGHAPADPPAAGLDRAQTSGSTSAGRRSPTVSLYYDHGDGKRYRSLGCYPCTHAVDSAARNVDDIIVELQSGKFANIAERSGRAQDQAGGGGLETLRRDGLHVDRSRIAPCSPGSLSTPQSAARLGARALGSRCDRRLFGADSPRPSLPALENAAILEKSSRISRAEFGDGICSSRARSAIRRLALSRAGEAASSLDSDESMGRFGPVYMVAVAPERLQPTAARLVLRAAGPLGDVGELGPTAAPRCCRPRCAQAEVHGGVHG